MSTLGRACDMSSRRRRRYPCYGVYRIACAHERTGRLGGAVEGYMTISPDANRRVRVQDEQED